MSATSHEVGDLLGITATDKALIGSAGIYL
jgi:hypothetical protein